jgi:hypothetical protein
VRCTRRESGAFMNAECTRRAADISIQIRRLKRKTQVAGQRVKATARRVRSRH